MRGYIVLLLTLLLLLCTSCRITRQVLSIEVQEPAPVTLPVNIARVLVVNNALPQPPDIGISRHFSDSLKYEKQETGFDSLAWLLTESFGYTLDQGKFFNEVSFYKEKIREDQEWLSSIPLPEQFSNEVFGAQEYDAIISLDKILYNYNDSVKKIGLNEGYEQYMFIDAKAEVSIKCSLHLFDRRHPLTSFVMEDSLIFKNTFIAEPNYIGNELPKLLLEDISINAGERLAYHFIPSWATQRRLIYTHTPRMMEGYRYADNKRWSRAIDIWELEYQSAKPINKVRLATNIAFAYEMTDQFQVAYGWAMKAQEELEEAEEDAGLKEYVKSYTAQLQKRIFSAQMLDIQFGGK